MVEYLTEVVCVPGRLGQDWIGGGEKCRELAT
jgi:hypothetical protein